MLFFYLLDVRFFGKFVLFGYFVCFMLIFCVCVLIFDDGCIGCLFCWVYVRVCRWVDELVDVCCVSWL